MGGGKPAKLLPIPSKCYQDTQNFKSNSCRGVNVVTHTIRMGLSKYIYAAYITVAIACVLILL